MSAVPAAKTHIRYRPYIDGLRGIAIIAVVLNHARFFGFTGGFVGVDVFFVISGFLITSIIVRDLNEGVFSLRGFWERRVRRIFPALATVMACTIVAAHFLILYPPDYHHFGTTVMAQSAFVSNVLFMRTDNYFDQPSHYSPLLHTWSLSVEEQFYMLFPLLVLGCVWLARRISLVRVAERGTWTNAVLVCVIGLLAVSFFANVWLVNIKPGTAFVGPFFPHQIFSDTSYATAGFYLLPARAWELGVGIFAALLSLEIESSILAEVASLGGIIAIFAAAYMFNDTTPYPGIAALVPTCGALAVIVGNERHLTRSGALLASPLLVWVGLISYSLYLWHWPIFVFANLAFSAPLGRLAMAGLIILSVFVAWFSYAFVETPFRKKTLVRPQSMIFGLGVGAMMLLAGVGYAIENANFLFSDNLSPAANATLSFLDSAQREHVKSRCFQLAGDQGRYGGLCRVGDQNAAVKPQFVVWGDSHAHALAPLLDSLGQRRGMQGVVFEGVIPIPGVWAVPYSEDLQQEDKFALQFIRDADIKTVIIAGRWSWYVMGGPDRLREKLITDSALSSNSPDDAQRVLERHFVSMVRELASEGRMIYIVRQVPEQFDYDPRTAFYRSVHTGQVIQTQGVSVKTSAAYQSLANAVIDKLSTIPNVHVLDPSRLMCGDAICSLWKGDTLLYRDENHLSEAGVMNLEPLFSPIFQKISAN